MNDELIWHDRPEPGLHRPVLIAAFTGWFDIAGGATAAIRHLGGDDGRLLAAIDPDGFFDFTASRPTVTLDDDGQRVVAWPRNEIRAGGAGAGREPPAAPTTWCCLKGEEPNIRWGTLRRAAARGGAAAELRDGRHRRHGGRHPAAHPQAPGVRELDQRGAGRPVGAEPPALRGPDGRRRRAPRPPRPCRGTRHRAARPVPHYLAASPNPKSTVALLQHLEHVLGVPTGHGALGPEVEEWDRRHDAAVASDDEAPAYVRQLEIVHDRRLDAAVAEEHDLAAELEAFLREQRGDDPLGGDG